MLKPVHHFVLLIMDAFLMCHQVRCAELLDGIKQEDDTLPLARLKFSKCLPVADGEIITSKMFILFSKQHKLGMGGGKQILLVTFSLTY